MRFIDIKIADADDWVGIYVDDELLMEDHSFPIQHLNDILAAAKNRYNEEVAIYSINVVFDVDTYATGGMPENYSDLKFLQ